MEGIGLIHGLFGADHGFLSVVRPVRPHADLPQHGADRQAGIGIVVRHQSAKARQLRQGLEFGRRIADSARQIYDEFAALARSGLHGNGTTHHINDVFGDRHAQASALDAADRTGLFTGKGLEDRLLEFFAHADPVVLDTELKVGEPLGGRCFFDHPKADGAARRGKLDGVGQNVQKHLIEPQLVRDDVLMGHVLGVDEQLQLLGGHIGLDDRPQIVDHIRKMHLRLLDGHLAAFDPAHIQNIVDEGQQMLAGDGDLSEVILHLFPVVDVRGRQRRKAHNGVHGRAHVMGHVVEEGGLCVIGMLRRCQRVRQRLLALCQLPVLFLQLQAGAFLFLYFRFCSPGITHEQEDDKRRDDQDDGSYQCHMFQHHIQKTVRIKLPRVPV